MQRKSIHPIEAIYDARDFHEAMDILRRAYEFEARLCAQGNEGAVESDEYWEREAERVREARAIYDRHVAEAVKAAIAEMRASEHMQVREIADALEDGDYSSLAF